MKRAGLLILFLAFLLGGMAQEDLYAPGTIHEIRIHFQQGNWRHILDSLFTNLGDAGKLIGDVTIDGHLCRESGIRYKGYSSYNANEVKNPFNIDLNYIIQHQGYQGHVKLKLSNVIQDPSFLREVLSYEIAARYMPVSRANFAKVYVNDTLIGLYTNVEAVDDLLIDKFWGSSGNTFFKGEPVKLLYPFGQNANLALTHGTDVSGYYPYYNMESLTGWDDLYRLISLLNQGADSVSGILNTDRALWMHAFNEVLVNLDSYIGYAQNYYMYRDDNGRFNPILWDMNMSFGSFRDSDASYNFQGMTIKDAKELDPLGLTKFAVSPRPLMTRLFANDTLRKIYYAHMRTILDENFHNGWYMARGQVLQDLINADVERDTNRFYSYQDFLSNLNVTVGGTGGMKEYPGLKDLMEARMAYLDTLEGFSGQPVISGMAHTPEVPVKGEECSITARIDGATMAMLGCRFRSGGVFSMIPMLDDGLHNDGVAGDGVYGATVTLNGETMQYYIYAENTKAAALSPERAEYEFYTIQPELLPGNVVINEVKAGTGGWAELFNTTGEPFNLAGMTLGNDPATTGWTLPDTVLGPRSYLVLYPVGVDSPVGLSFPFMLPTEGGYLSLVNLQGRVVDTVTYGIQVSGKSTGRYPNGYGALTYMIPTKATYNQLGTTPSTGFLMYPNPASDKVMLELRDGAGSATVTLFNAMGMKVAEKASEGIQSSSGVCLLPVDVSSLGSGLYLVKVKCNNEESIQKLVVY